MSKGDKPRPVKDQKQFDDNWDKIFNKKKKVTKNVTSNQKVKV